MFITKRHMPRRTFLRGVGATIALPLLDAMVPAMAQAPAPQSRYSFLHVPHGAAPGYWRPTGSGKNWELSRILHADRAVQGSHHGDQRHRSPHGDVAIPRGKRRRPLADGSGLS